MGIVDQRVIESAFINFDPLTNLTSGMCAGEIPMGLSGKYVLAEECTRFVFEHCVGKLRFFMIISAIFLLTILTLMNRHGYLDKEKAFIKKEWGEFKRWLMKKQCKK